MPKLFERPEGGHALDLYEALVGCHPSGGRNYQLQHAWTFARLYPELDGWLNAPLDERIGTSEVRRGTAFATIKGRQYIYFLASIGRIDLDWDWIIGVSDHRFRDDYAHLSDATVREDYMKVLGPGALIAGPLAEAIRSRAMPADSLAWLKVNFFRTELELGHCLRLPEEGPCECDLYLSCAKFATTPDYAPRLRERRLREITLADEARVKGFHREAERHDCTRGRIDELLSELGESAQVAAIGIR